MKTGERIVTKNYTEGRDGHSATALVLHITGGSYYSTKQWFENGSARAGAPVSAHWILDKQGVWHECVNEKDTAWHAGKRTRPSWGGLHPVINPNTYTIGIEVENSGEFPPFVQLISWVRGIKEIASRNHIPLDDVHVANHNEIRADKTCPGNWFSKRYLFILSRIF